MIDVSKQENVVTIKYSRDGITETVEIPNIDVTDAKDRAQEFIDAHNLDAKIDEQL